MGSGVDFSNFSNRPTTRDHISPKKIKVIKNATEVIELINSPNSNKLNIATKSITGSPKISPQVKSINKTIFISKPVLKYYIARVNTDAQRSFAYRTFRNCNWNDCICFGFRKAIEEPFKRNPTSPSFRAF